jgi:futalosine hydrolase
MKNRKSVHILIVAATRREIEPFLEQFPRLRMLRSGFTRIYTAGVVTDVMITGVGMVPTAVKTASVLARNTYDLAINAGICGSFNRAFSPGDVVHITSECLPETGAQDGERFISLTEMGLLKHDEFPFTSGRILNENPTGLARIDSLQRASGLTVNTVHGEKNSIEILCRDFPADTESMEGAAFFYACRMHGQKFAEVRSISNYVEPRDPSKWDIPLAIQKLNQFLTDFLHSLEENTIKQP